MNMPDIEWRVILTALLNGAVIVVPGALIGAAADSESILNVLSFVLWMFGMVFTGYVAGRLATRLPLAHGTVAAVLLAAAQMSVTVMLRLIRNESFSIFAILLLLTIASSVGMIGALFSGSRAAKMRQGMQ
ncbi:MAG: hypothetical protein ACC652_01365 [Acidimicrobiales bacterium]